MRGGVRRLAAHGGCPDRAARSNARSISVPTLAVAAGSIALSDLAADAIEAAVDAVMSRYELPWDDGAFARIERAVRQDTPAARGRRARGGGRHRRRRESGPTTHRGACRPRRSARPSPTPRPTSAGSSRPGSSDGRAPIASPTCIATCEGIEYRLDHLGGDVARDQRRMAEVRPIERSIAGALDGRTGRRNDLRALAWMVEELRMSTFAQPLGVDGPVSVEADPSGVPVDHRLEPRLISTATCRPLRCLWSGGGLSARLADGGGSVLLVGGHPGNRLQLRCVLRVDERGVRRGRRSDRGDLRHHHVLVLLVEHRHGADVRPVRATSRAGRPVPSRCSPA